jgi:hypothetical protein
MDSAGNLYGVGGFGGAGYGAVFELSPMPSGGCPSGSNQGNGWCETVIHSFNDVTDGYEPASALVMDSAGNLYGTTELGLGICCGTVFELSPSNGSWTFSTLFVFPNVSPFTAGKYPEAALTLDASGNLYGTTNVGGAHNYGDVFELSPEPSGGCPGGTTSGNGWCQTVLFSFAGSTNGDYPFSDLTFYQGNLYGTTSAYGPHTPNGTVFELTPISFFGGTCPATYNPGSGNLTVFAGNGWCLIQLHAFNLSAGEGSSPYQGVVFDSQGNLYGDTYKGGSHSYYGSVYKISPVGTFTTLFSFDAGATDGLYPRGKLLLDANDNLYGTSYYAGPGCTTSGTQCKGFGAVWELSPPTVTINLSSSLNPSIYGQSVTFTAALPAVNGVTPTGTVTFMNGTATLATQTLSSGSATYTTSLLAIGTDPITVVYSGDSIFSGSTSGILNQVVNLIPQTITCSGIPQSAVYGTNFTASCTGGASGNPVVLTHSLYPIGCTNSGGTFTITSGTVGCGVDATQAGSATYAAAPLFYVTVAELTAPSATGLTSNLSPSNYGQAVNFTVMVTAPQGVGTPTGTVQFFADSNPTPFDTETLASGTATSNTINSLTAGAHTITAVYSGDSNFSTSSGATAQTVNTAGPNSVVVSSTGSPSSYGQSVTFTATINGANGLVKRRNVRGKPQDVTGTVTWSGNTGCGTTPITSGNPGTATCTVPNSAVSSLAVGSYTITATYSGDSNHNGGDNGSFTQQVVASASTTTVAPAASSPNPSGYGQAVNFTATVVPAVQGAGTPTGSVQFLADGILFDTETLPVSGVVTSAAISTLTVASHTISAVYSGDASFSSSTGTVTQVVSSANAGMTIASNLNPSAYGQAITFTATMTADNGLVRRRNGAKPLDVTGTVTWSGNTGCGTTTVAYTPGTGVGTATCTTSSLPVGTADIIGATYSGDSNHNGSTGSINQVVDPANAAVSITSDISPSTYGETVSFTASMTADNGLFKRRNGVKPQDVTGTVTWSDNTGCGTTSVTSTAGSGVGTATCLTSSLPGGTDTVTASYSGDSNHNAGSGTIAQVVNAASQHITVTTYPPSSAAYGSSFTVMASASSGLPVTFGLLGSDCSVSNVTPTSALYTVGTKPGPCTVTLAQAGNNDYQPVPTITENTTAVVAPLKRTVSFTALAPATAPYQSTFTVTAQSQSVNDTTLPTIAVVTPAAGTAPCAVLGTTTNGTAVSANVQMTSGTGTCNLTATWPLGNVFAAATAKTSAKATKLTPAITWTPAAITYGTALGSGQLNAIAAGYNGAAFTDGTYTYTPAAGKVLNAGTQSLKVTFKPSATDALNYTETTGTASLQVSQAATTTAITATTPNPSVTGRAVRVSVEVTSPGKATGGFTITADTGESCTIARPTATGTGSCSLTITHTGTRTLTAVYAGDVNTTSSTSAGYTQTVTN